MLRAIAVTLWRGIAGEIAPHTFARPGRGKVMKEESVCCHKPSPDVLCTFLNKKKGIGNVVRHVGCSRSSLRKFISHIIGNKVPR